jgi:DNA repair protein RadD
MGIELRPHQKEAHRAALDYLIRQKGKAGLISHCVASGKSITQAAIAKSLIEAHPGINVLGLTMSKELIEQNAADTRRYWPTADVGVNCGGLKQRDTKNRLVFAHPYSIVNDPGILGPRQLVLIDEVHNVSRKVLTSTYGRIITGIRQVVPSAALIGLSGTMWRLDSGRLDQEYRGEKPMWDSTLHEYTIAEGIRDGYLVQPITKQPDVTMDAKQAGVKTQGRDWQTKSLGEAFNTDDLNQAIVQDLIARTAQRRSVVVFCIDVEHAQNITNLLRQHGQSAVCVSSRLGDVERDDTINYFRRGGAKFLVNVQLATTGFSHKPVDCVAMLRPTKSSGLMIQMIGRGLRLYPGKTNCLVLDYADNVFNLGCIDKIDGYKGDPMKSGEAPTKVCDICSTVMHAGARKCDGCGREWDMSGQWKLNTSASDAAVTSDQKQAKWIDVSNVVYRKHQKRDRDGKPVGKPSFRVEYHSGFRTYSEWLAFESDKPGGVFYARQKWQARCTTMEMPDTVDAALALTHLLREPGRIQVVKDGKHWKVKTIDLSVEPIKVRALSTQDSP